MIISKGWNGRRIVLWGLWERRGKRWVRVFSGLAFPRSEAVTRFQNALLEPSLTGGAERRLMPVGHWVRVPYAARTWASEKAYPSIGGVQ